MVPLLHLIDGKSSPANLRQLSTFESHNSPYFRDCTKTHSGRQVVGKKMVD